MRIGILGSGFTARYTEPFALQLACERDGGPELAYRFERYR